MNGWKEEDPNEQKRERERDETYVFFWGNGDGTCAEYAEHYLLSILVALYFSYV